MTAPDRKPTPDEILDLTVDGAFIDRDGDETGEAHLRAEVVVDWDGNEPALTIVEATNVDTGRIYGADELANLADETSLARALAKHAERMRIARAEGDELLFEDVCRRGSRRAA